eukprot:TRINITY_DN27482_c0_g1_i1.p1 TRINITY_DN27482_c0_g1~~TRINITY_DN27482_c0_g1_i1.p1  ORF type:complete len:395 (-),score=43.76 TRINITY_DN27482_c0_g1_i1:94-1278(-)
MAFSTQEYWAGRYRNGRSPGEWYLGSASSSTFFDRYIVDFIGPPSETQQPTRVLHLGCGDSLLPLELAIRRPALQVHSVDFEPTIIARMQDKHGHECPRLTWAVEDVRSLSSTAESFDVVLDKGCFDALRAGQDSKATVAEVYRVLKPGGVFLCLSNNDVFLRKYLLEMHLPFLMELRCLRDLHGSIVLGDAGASVADSDDDLIFYLCRKPHVDVLDPHSVESRFGCKAKEALVLEAKHWSMRYVIGYGVEVTFHGRGGELSYSVRALRMSGLLTKRRRRADEELVGDEDDEEVLPCLEVFLPAPFESSLAHARRKRASVKVWLPARRFGEWYDPSFTEGVCGWKTFDVPPALKAFVHVERCSEKPPSGARRFCVCSGISSCEEKAVLPDATIS